MQNYAVFIISLIISAFAGCMPAQAKTQYLTYDVYAGGLHAVEATMVYDQDKDSYDLIFAARTRGFLGSVAPWSGSFESKGVRQGEDFQPDLHESVSIWRDEKETKTYHYNPDGTFDGLTIIEDGEDKSPDDLDKELVNGTIDALTAATQVMHAVGEGQGCESSADVFDGKRRFKMVFRDSKKVNLSPSRYNRYAGPAVSCEVEVIPDGGAWYKKPRGWLSIQEQGREKGQLPKLWFAKLDESLPAVPVRVLVKSDYGAMLLHLTGYGIEDFNAAQARFSQPLSQ